MSECVLVSCANDIRIWDLQKQSALSEFSPHKSTVNCVRWNHNNQVLVSGGDDGEVVLSHQTGRSLGRLPTDVSKSEPVRALAFSSGSRYLCSGGTSQVVDVWDLKKKEKTRSFTGHTAGITAAVFGRGDSKVASASESGAILIHTVVSGTQAAALQIAADPVRSLEYSPTEQHLLASGGDGGSLDLWDTNTQTRLKSWTAAHQDIISQVAFSPSSLLCSVGFDKRLQFFDLSTQRVVKQVITDYPLTCLDFFDGVTLAVGTEGSHILCYDLRKTDSPVYKIMGAHPSPAINCLKFQSQRLKRATGEETPEKASPSSSGLFPLSPSSPPTKSAPVSPAPERPAPSSSRAVSPLSSTTPSLPLPSSSSLAVGAADVSFINTCVNEAMTEVRLGVKENLNNLHVDMLRQFHQQMVDMKELLKNFSDEQAALVSEVKSMREMYKLLPSNP